MSTGAWGRGGPLDVRVTPWYRVQPSRAMVLAVALFAGVTALQWFSDGAGEAIAVLYVLPIALVAVTSGLSGGLKAAAAGFTLFSLFELTHATGDIDATGWVVRAVAMFLLGGLLGRATDQANASEQAALDEQQRRHQAEEANHRYAEALEINDSIIQQMVAAKWMVERGQCSEALDLLSDTITRGERVVAELLPPRVTPPSDGAAQRATPVRI